jgi:hypothetical protein
MFEDALMESSSTIKTRSKYWSLPALAMNCALLSAMIVWPLLHPEALPKQAMASLLVAPLAPPTAPPLQTLYEHSLGLRPSNMTWRSRVESRAQSSSETKVHLRLRLELWA